MLGLRPGERQALARDGRDLVRMRLTRPLLARNRERLPHPRIRRLEGDFAQIAERDVHEFARLHFAARADIETVDATATASEHFRRLFVDLGRQDRRVARTGRIVADLRPFGDFDSFAMKRHVERLAHPRAAGLRMNELDIVATAFSGKIHDPVDAAVHDLTVGKDGVEADEHSLVLAVAQEIERTLPRAGNTGKGVVFRGVHGVDGRHDARHAKLAHPANLLRRRAMSRRIDPDLKSANLLEHRLQPLEPEHRLAALDRPGDDAEVTHLADVLDERRERQFVRIVLALIAMGTLVGARLRDRKDDAHRTRRTADDLVLQRGEERLARIARHVEVELVLSARQLHELVLEEDTGEARCLQKNRRRLVAPRARQRHARVEEELSKARDVPTLFHRDTRGRGG